MPRQNKAIYISEEDLKTLIQETKRKVEGKYKKAGTDKQIELDINPVVHEFINSLIAKIQELSLRKPEILEIEKQVIVKEPHIEVREIERPIIVEKEVVKEIKVPVTKGGGISSTDSWEGLEVVYDGLGRVIGFNKKKKKVETPK